MNATQDMVMKRRIELRFPDTASDEFGNHGFWTLIYNQGFEISVAGRKYFLYSAYDSSTNQSVCGDTMGGWAHTVNGMDWSCSAGQKLSSIRSPSPILYKDTSRMFSRNTHAYKSLKYRANAEFIDTINSVQSSWRATHYKVYETKTLGDLHMMAGGPKSKIAGIPHPMNEPLSEELREKLSSVPDEFDWRNAGGRNFVSPVRNQGSCGSCFAFSSLAMHEARLRIMTNMTQTPVFSTQDIVECCRYSQGCSGGFPYLVAGKYATDFGLVQEQCNPYTGKDGACATEASCQRTFGFDYKYVGGFYGACNEMQMKLALMRGPLAVSFMVYNDFFAYKGGVYHHVEGLEDKFNPFEITNHAVLLVGYGVDPESGPYWSVKNSWGSSWGEDGYFRIRRGTDECSIESIAVEAFPVL
ncbi:dipeptidyl peptidase 1-like [Watersipora subatra]|uniref:dipeptidyl peptidase 1-like n=1 Tax=Watersipora subatra TaxID=2589382 RepID=UPI00355BE0EE